MLKKFRQVYVLFIVFWLPFVPSVYAGTVSQAEPSQMVQQVSNQLIMAMNEQREALKSSPPKVKAFADTYVLPYMDASKMARYSMGRYWRTATSSQKKAFIEAFTEMLMRSYAGSLLKLNIDSISVKPAKIEKPGRALVYSVVKQSNGHENTLVYRLFLNKKTQKWMVYDVTIEGISLLLNYRKMYASEFATKGVDKVIAEMDEKNKAFLNGSQVEVVDKAV